MPKIPLYNKGLGSTGITSGGSLGPRASAGAFTGVGQQLAKFGESAGQIMFDFYDADQKAAAKTAIADAENELVKQLGTHIDNDKSVTAQEFDTNYTKFSNKKIQDISSKYNLRPNEQKAMIAKLGDLSAGVQLKGRQQTYTRRDQIRGISVNDTLTRLRSTMASSTPGNPLFEKARIDAINLIDESQKDGSIKYSSIRSKEQLDLQVEEETLNNKISGASSFSDIAKTKELINESTLSDSIKNKFNKALRAKRTVLATEKNQSIQDEIQASNPTFEELNKINEKLRNNQDVNITLASGKTISISGLDLPQNVSNAIQNFISKESKLVEDDFLNGITEDISETAENVDTKTALDTAKFAVGKSKNKEKAEGAVIGSAQYLYYRQKTLLETYKEDPSQVNVDKIRQLGETARQLLQTGYSGRTSLEMQQTANGRSARTVLTGIIDVENDLIKAQNDAQFIQNGVTSLNNGQYSKVRGLYTEKQEKKLVNIGMQGRTLADQLLMLQQNNVSYGFFENELSEGATNILGDQADIPKLKTQIELFRQMKAMGPGPLTNHLNQNEIAIYNQVLSLEQVGKSIEEAIVEVNDANRSGIDISAKYKTIKNEVDKISREVTPYFDEKPQNSSVIQQKVENLSKIYIGLGKSPKAAVEQAGQDIINSHINHRGVLIPRSKNMNEEDIREFADLIIEDYKLKNPEDTDEITATPVTGRVDRWSVVRNGGLYPNASYTLDELIEMKKAKEDKLAQEKMQQTIQEQKEKQLARIKSPEEQRKAKMMQQNKEQLAEFFKTDFSKGFKDKTEAALAREKEKEDIRKENIEFLKGTLLGPKGRELLD